MQEQREALEVMREENERLAAQRDAEVESVGAVEARCVPANSVCLHSEGSTVHVGALCSVCWCRRESDAGRESDSEALARRRLLAVRAEQRRLTETVLGLRARIERLREGASHEGA